MWRLLLAAVLAAVGADAQGMYTRRDLYAEMNLTRDATKKDIKRMYQKWSRMLHPDHTQWDAQVAKKRMIQISEAYEVLSDPSRRDHFDRTGMMDTGTDSNTEERRARMFDGENDIYVIRNKEKYKQIREEGDNWMIFFWSVRYPDALEQGMTWMRFASRMKGIVNVGAVACDEDLMQLCREMGLRHLPAGIFIKEKRIELYRGKVETQSMVDFAATNLLNHADRAITDYTPGQTVRSFPLEEHMERAAPGSSLTSGAFLLQPAPSTLAANEVWDLVTFEYTDCMDCRIELRLAVEALARNSKQQLRVVRTDCHKEANKQFCSQFPQAEGRAWNIAHGRRSTYYAPSKDHGLQRIATTEWDFEPFTFKTRRYTARDLINFVFELQQSSIIKLTPAAFTRTVLTSETAWAIMFTSSSEECTACEEAQADWEILARLTQGYVSPKGTKLRVASIDCATYPAFCSSMGFGALDKLPALRMWGGGVQRKKEAPYKLRRQDPYSMLNEAKREMEPLTVVNIDPTVWQSEVVSEEGLKGNWFILFNAGTWCPPCNQVREPWKVVSRLVDESHVGPKTRIGYVDCDAHKSLCNEVGIESYPTFTLRKEGDVIHYDGNDRRAEPVSNWAIQQLDNYVIKLDARKVVALSTDRTQPSVIAFAAGDWCPPCNMVKGFWKTLSKRLYPLKFGIVNCDDNQDLCGKYGIGGYPGLVIYPNGPESPTGQPQRRVSHKYNQPRPPNVAILEEWIKETVPWVKWDPRPE